MFMGAGKMILELKNNKIRFSLEFYGKFNILTGKSGSHKTHLVNSIKRAKKKVSSVKCRCLNDDEKDVSLEKILFFDNETLIAGDYHDIFNQYQGGLIIIDECSDLLKQADIASVLKSTNNQVLLISRTMIGWLPISVDSIYCLEMQDYIITNRSIYCEHNSDLIKKGYFSYVLTEDSGSGRDFFLAQFPDKEVCSKHVTINGINMTRDNSHLHNSLEKAIKEGKKDILVVFDAAAYGSYFKLLLDVIKHSDVQVTLLSWESFENYLLSSPYFGIVLTKKDVSWRFNSLEQLSTIKLKEVNNGYSKTKLDPKFKHPEFLYGYLADMNS